MGLNLALIGPERVREPGVCGRPSRGLEWPWGHGTTRTGYWLGPGNTNVDRGWVGTRYSTLPVYPARYPPGIPPSRYPPTRPPVLQCGHHQTAVLGGPKEILGVYNAQVHARERSGPHAEAVSASCRHLTPQLALPLRLLVSILHYSSVFLSISQYISDPSISQILVYLRS